VLYVVLERAGLVEYTKIRWRTAIWVASTAVAMGRERGIAMFPEG